MAIALTPFEGLCGFQPIENIVNNMKSKSKCFCDSSLSNKAISENADGILILIGI